DAGALVMGPRRIRQVLECARCCGALTGPDRLVGQRLPPAARAEWVRSRLRCSLLTDPLRDMLVARASPGGKNPCRKTPAISETQHEFARYSGSAKATMLPPAGRPDFAPPAQITTNWRPLIIYVLGLALPPNGRAACQRIAPVCLSNARKVSSAVAPMKIRPPAVTSGPP